MNNTHIFAKDLLTAEVRVILHNCSWSKDYLLRKPFFHPEVPLTEIQRAKIFIPLVIWEPVQEGGFLFQMGWNKFNYCG